MDRHAHICPPGMHTGPENCLYSKIVQIIQKRKGKTLFCLGMALLN
jgi:hypothetical protein